MYLDLREIVIGVLVGLLIAGGAYAFIYGPGYLRELSLPAKQHIKFIAVENLSLRDWALRLKEETIQPSYTATAYLRSDLLNAAVVLKDIRKVSQESKTVRVFGQFENLHPPYELFGKFEAHITDKKPTIINIDLLSGKISDDVSVNRISGKLKFTEMYKSGNIEGTLQIGSVNYGGLPFGGTQLKISGDINQIEADIVTQISGHDGTTLNVTGIFQNTELTNMEGFVSIESYQDLSHTLKMMASGTDYKPPEFIKNLDPLKINFTQNQKESRADTRKINISSPDLGNGFKGIALFNVIEKKIQIAGRFENFWPKELPFGLTKKAGDIISQGMIELSFNQQPDEKYGPYITKIENLSLEKGNFFINGLNGKIEYSSLNPLIIKNSNLSASSMMLDAVFKDISLNLDYEDGLKINKLSALWNNEEIDLNISSKPENQLPDLSIKKEYKNISHLAEILHLDLKFSAPLQLSKSWEFEKEGYVSKDMSFTNTRAGLLTLNENLPELSNLYIKDMTLTLEKNNQALLIATGTNPLLYGSKPVRIETKLQRLVDP